MSELYFRIKSNWSEVVRLRQEIARLENQLNHFNGKASLSVLTKLCDELSAAKSRMQSLLDDAAIAGKQLEKSFQKPIKIDISTSEGQLKAFDAQIMKMCSSLDAYFNGLKSRLRELQSLLGDGQTLTGNIRINDDNSRRIEEVKRQNEELQEQIKQQTAEIEHQQSQWQQLAEAVRNNNVSAIKQLSQQTDEATRRLHMDAAKGSLNGIKAELDELAEKMAVAEGDAERLKAALDDLRSRQSTGDASVTDDKISETEALYRKACDELSNMKSEYNSMSAEQKKYIDQLKSASGHHTRMRTEIMDAREQMAQLIAAGQTGTPAFRQLAEQAATMQKQITIANATMQYFANPTRHLETLKVAMQGVAGAAGLVTGLFGIFNSESEKMTQIQTRVQSILGIIVGLETTYATVKKTSNVMMAVSEFQAWAATRAKQAEAAATNAGTMATIRHTAAQRVFNAVARANPYVLLASAIGALGVALYSMAKSTKTATAAQEALNKAQEEQRKINATLGSAIGETIASYMVLQKQWQSLSSAQEKNKWIDENSSKFKQMGLNITDINSAEDAFVNNSKAVINALKARAEAEAWGEIYKERIKKKAENDMNGSVANGRYVENFHAGDKVNVGKLRNTYGKIVNTNTVGGSEGYFRVDGMHFGTSYSDNEFVRLTEASAHDLNEKALEIANGIIQAEDEAIKVAEDAMVAAQERAAEAAKELGGLQSGNTGKGSTNGKTPDDIVKQEIEQEQEANRMRQQNLLLQEQSIIDLMDDGAEKELAQMRLNHKKRMVELDNEQQDILNKKIETASKDSKGNVRKGFYTTGQYKNVQLTDDEMLGVNSKRMSEMVSMFDSIAKSSANTEDRMIALRQAYSDFVSDVEDSSGNKLISDDAFANIETQFKRVEASIRREEFTAMREYLREYGSYEQQRLAITQEYEERIKKARTEGERLKLQKERDKALSNVSYQNISMGIDWSALLNGVGSLSQEMLKPMLEQLKAYTKTDDFNNADIQEREKVVELIDELKRYIGTDQNATWQQLSAAIANFTDAVAKYRDADAQEKAAQRNVAEARTKLTKGEITQADFDQIEREARDLGLRTAEAREEMQNLGRTLNETSDEVKNYVSPLTTALNKMTAWDGVEGMSGLKGSVAQFDQLKGTLDSILPSMGDGMAKTIGTGLSSVMGSGLSALGDGLSSVMSSGIGGIIGIVAQLPRMILQLADTIKNLVTGILDSITELLKFEWLSDLVNSILDAVGNLIDAIFDLPEHLFNAISSIVVDGIGGLIDGVLGRVGNILSFGLLDSKGPSSWFTNSNAEEVAKTTEELTAANERLQKSIDGLREEIKTNGGSKSIKSAQEALEANKKYIENQRGILNAQQGYHNAHHSNAYYWDIDRNHQTQINRLLADYAVRNNKTASRVGSDWSSFAKLSPEEMDFIRSHDAELWKWLEDIGKYDKSEFFEAFADLAGSEKEILDSLNEALTQTTFDSLKSNFISNLMDMTRSAEDFSEDFTEMMMQAILNARISDLMDKEIQDFYNTWAKLSKDASGNGYELTETELNTLQKMWDDIINHGMKIRDEVAAVTGYDESQAAKQEADKKGFQAMSQDTGEELNGRFTAVQIAGENVSAQMNVAVPILRNMDGTTTRIADMVDGIGRVADDMLTNIVECYTELNIIRTNTEDLVEIGKKHTASLQKIADCVKRL
ncbi:MAG: hypothetical protein IJ640_00615 [Prevotella sp.]|nr:hypothetical protein [Prevotella sp.]